MFIKFGNTSGKENSQMWYNMAQALCQVTYNSYNGNSTAMLEDVLRSIPLVFQFRRKMQGCSTSTGMHYVCDLVGTETLCLHEFSSTFAWNLSFLISKCLPVSLLQLVILLYWSITSDMVCMHFPTLEIAFSILLAPRPCTASLHNLFKCSMCKSDSMLCPAIPHVFMNLEFKSCWAWHGGNRKWYWRSIRGASIE